MNSSFEVCFWRCKIRASYFGLADRWSVAERDAEWLGQYLTLFGMVTLPASSESSCPIRKGCSTLHMKALWPLEMSGTADWHNTMWIVSSTTKEGLKSCAVTCCMQNVVKLCHLTCSLQLLLLFLSVVRRCADLVVSYLGYRIFFSILHPGGNFCLCYIINKFVLPFRSLNLWLVLCAMPNIFIGIPSILHNTAAALGLWIECELEKWVWDDNTIHAVGHITTQHNTT